MGQQRGINILVVMTNGDVYYLSRSGLEGLLQVLNTRPSVSFYETTDVRSKSRITIATKHVSSIVTKELGDV